METRVQVSKKIHWLPICIWEKTYIFFTFFRALKFLPSENPAKARQEAIHYAKNFKVDNIFFISSVAHLENPSVLKALIKENVPVIAPFLKTYETFGYARRICDVGMEQPLNDSHSFPFLVTQKGLREYNYEFIKIGTNFVTKDVLEARNSTIYNDTSFWTTIPQSEAENVPIFKKINDRIYCQKLPQVEAIRSAYLVQTEVFPESNYREYFENDTLTVANVTDDNAIADGIFSQTMKSLNISLYLLSTETYGQLVNLYNVLEDKLHPELTRIMENHDLWETRYIQDEIRKTFSRHPDVMPEILPKDTVKPGFCPDTYQFPMFSGKKIKYFIIIHVSV